MSKHENEIALDNEEVKESVKDSQNTFGSTK